MRPLETVYWIRFGLGVAAALACVGYMIGVYGMPFPQGWAPNIFLNSMSIAIIVYLISYYVIKGRFKLKVEKTQKLFTTGIGIYFLAWLVFYTLVYTTLSGV